MGGLDPELQELLALEEAERQSMHHAGQQTLQPGGQQWTVQQGQSVQMSPGSPGMAAQVDPQAALALAETQMLRQQLEHTGASG
jgi:hypothetical protein